MNKFGAQKANHKRKMTRMHDSDKMIFEKFMFLRCKIKNIMMTASTTEKDKFIAVVFAIGCMGSPLNRKEC